MLNEFSRMEILLGEEGVEILAKAKVAVFGLGGVGSYVADEEAGTITYELKGETYVFEYSLEDKVAITLTYDGQTLVVPYVMTNSAK